MPFKREKPMNEAGSLAAGLIPPRISARHVAECGLNMMYQHDVSCTTSAKLWKTLLGFAR